MKSKKLAHAIFFIDLIDHISIMLTFLLIMLVITRAGHVNCLNKTKYK